MQEEADRIVYSGCFCNCGSTSQCILKVYLKEGKVLAVEPDDRFNAGVGREDEVLTEQELLAAHLQRRPCTRGLAFHKYVYQQDRILYPLKRIAGTPRGAGQYERISWDEALDTIAAKMQQTRAQYGPYSIITPYANKMAARLFSHWGAGVDAWGWSSFDSARLMSHLIAGERGWDYPAYTAGSAPDMLANSKMIVLWGSDPSRGSQGPGYQMAWFIKLARERGIPVVVFDPRYTMAAEVLADQWIPVKPGTDSAIFMALAYVLFQQDSWNHEFVEKYVEPQGFAAWRAQVLGEVDGIAKTPEWAEQQCAVPAETLWDLGHQLGTVRPAYLWCHWGVSRKSRGEQTVRNFAALQAMLGYWGTPGAGPTFHSGPMRDIPYQMPLGPEGDYAVPHFYRSHRYAQAILLLDDLHSGKISEQEYRKQVGWRAKPELLAQFQPKMLFWGGHEPFGSNHLITVCETPNVQIKAMEKMDFIVNMHNRMLPTVKMADLILPARDYMWEERRLNKTEYGGFEAINFMAGVVEPPGEVKSREWVYTKLAERLGLDPRCFFSYYTDDEHWESDWERYIRDGYALTQDYYAQRGIKTPSWQEFTAGAFINCDELAGELHTGWDSQIKQGQPFRTASGKLELVNAILADENERGRDEHKDSLGRVIDNLPADWGDISAAPEWKTAVKSFQDERFAELPLTLLAPPCRYRVHSAMWENPYLRNQVYRHRVWLNVADAKARGITDDALVQVKNDRGTVVMPAYVTARIMPGVTLIHHGGGYEPAANGVDFGAAPSMLLGGDMESAVVPAGACSRVEVTLYQTADSAEKGGK